MKSFKKIIWLINPYGVLPNEQWRPYSYAIFGKVLSGRNYKVIWWTSCFSHHFKIQRSSTWKDIHVNSNFIIRLVPSNSYSKNISLKRILRDVLFSVLTYLRAKTEDRVDLIISSEPPLNFFFAGDLLAKHFKIPFVYYQMDLWPDLILNSFHKKFKILVKPLFYILNCQKRFLLKNAYGTIALSKKYLANLWNLNPVLKNRPSCVIYNGINIKKIRMTKSKNIILPKKNKKTFWSIFAGTIGPSYDIDTLIKAAVVFEKSKEDNYILVVGEGPDKIKVQNASKKCKNLIYLEKINHSKIFNLYKKCNIGICAYSSISNVEMPDKFYDYIAAGLPIVNSLNGEVAQIIKNKKIGLKYQSGNVKSLVKNIRLIKNNPKKNKEFSNNSHKLGKEYDINKQIKKLPKLISTVLKKYS